MHATPYLRQSITCFLLILPLLAAPHARAEAEPRSCSVKEVLKGGVYVYLRCQEKGKDIWLATVARGFRDGEEVRFVDAPPMLNFYSKQLDRIFPEVIFTDILPPAPMGR